jgi:hypothetical protein
MSNQLQITGDLKVKSLTGALTATAGVVASVPLGAANGVATLAGDGKVPSSQLPSYVDDVVEVANFAALPATGETGKIYITLDNNKIYRWTGSTYVEVSSSSAVWGAITGTLSNQTDLQNALNAKQNTLSLTTTGSSGAATLIGSTLNIPNYAPDLSGYVTIGTTQTITGTKTFSGASRQESGLLLKNGVLSGLSGYTSLAGASNGLNIQLSGSSSQQTLVFQSASAYTYTLPAATGTIALTSDLSSYVPTSRTLNINGTSFDLTANRTWTINVGVTSVTGTSPIVSSGGATPAISITQASSTTSGFLSSTDWNTFNNAATGSFLPISGGSLTGSLTINDGNQLNLGQGGSSNVPIDFYGSSFGSGYEGRIMGLNSDGNTHFYHRNNASSFTDIGYFSDGGMYITYYGSYSDIRLKNVIETNPDINLDSIDVIKYTLKSNPSLIRYGYSAQQVQSVLPDLVTLNKQIDGNNEDATLMLNYNDLYVLKIAALEKKMAELTQEVAVLKGKNN